MTPSLRVLVAHPDGDVRALCRAALVAAGHEVTDTADAAIASEAVRAVDVAMVATGGYDGEVDVIAACVRAEVPVVVLAGHEERPLDTWRAGATEHLAGPLSPDVVLQVLTDVTATAPAEREERRRSLLERPGLVEAEPRDP